jgi:hypothetical protein
MNGFLERATRAAGIAAALAALAGFAPARAEMRVIETRDLRLVYPSPSLRFLAPYAAQCFENSIRFHRQLFDYTPSEKVTVVLIDRSDYGNAAVVGSPRNTMIVEIAPNNFVYETGPGNERINFVMNHELAHVVTLDQTTGHDRLFRAMFRGKVRETSEHPESILYGFLTLPRRAAPRWHREGTAVFLETWMAGGLGRAQGPYDEMVFRSMVADQMPFYDPLGLESEGARADFQIGVNSYLYGTRFTSWMADRYGPDAVVRWVGRKAGSRAYYASQFERVTGEPLGRAWREWVDAERAFQRANLDSIRRHPTTGWRDLSQRALGSVSRAFVDTARATVYAGVFHPGTVAHIAAIPLGGGPSRTLHEVRGPALYFVCSLAWDPEGRQLFYTADNNAWRDLCVLDPDTRRSRTLIRDARIGDLAYNRQDRSLWGVRHFNGFSTVVRIPPPYREWNQIFTFPYGRDVYDLDISPDGQRIAMSMGEITGRHALKVMPLASFTAGDTTAHTLFDFGHSIPTSFVFSPDGRFLVGSSYYTGVSNIFRYDLEADSMDIVTNAETGFFRPVPERGDSMVVFRYAAGGFVPARIEARPLSDVSAITFYGQQLVEKRPELKQWKVPPPSRVVLDSVVTREGVYRSFRSIRLVSAYPIVEAYQDRTALGLSAVFSDPVSFHGVTLSATVSPDADLPADERFHSTLTYRRSRWNARFKYNPASFYDLFGPTKSARKGVGASLDWSRDLIDADPRTLSFGAGIDGWGGLERLPDAQNVATSAGFDMVISPDLSLSDRNIRSSIGAVDHEKGWLWNLGLGVPAVRFERASGEIWRGFPQLEAATGAGVPVPRLRNSSVWLRTWGGWSPGDRLEPFANFFFGGFGNNWVDVRDPKRYRDSGSFPGLELDEVAGTNYAKAMVEWNLPPLRFERAGSPALYASWLRTSVFGSALTTNLDLAPMRTRVANAGVQIDLRLALLSQQPLTLSGGWARAFERGQPSREEWMASLKIL